MAQGDKSLNCLDCKKPFVFAESEQAFFKEKGFIEPKRCVPCRRANKSKREAAAK